MKFGWRATKRVEQRVNTDKIPFHCLCNDYEWDSDECGRHSKQILRESQHQEDIKYHHKDNKDTKQNIKQPSMSVTQPKKTDEAGSPVSQPFVSNS